MKDIIFKLISSPIIADNMIGYSMLKDKTIKDVKKMWKLSYVKEEHHNHPYWELKFDKFTNNYENGYYKINDDLYVHCNSESVLFTHKPYPPEGWQGYTVL